MPVAPVQDRPQSSAGSGERGYIVKAGDNLFDIAQAHGVSLQDLEKANPQILHPSLIRPGQHINIPQSGARDGGGAKQAAPTEYTVRSGDTLSSIGAQFGENWRVLAQTNGVSNPDLIRPGQQLRITPGVSGGTTGAGRTGGVSTPTRGSGGAGGAHAYDIARAYLGKNASSLKTNTGDALPMDPNCPSSECCANFVSAVLVQAHELPASAHTDSVQTLKTTLQSRGWQQVPLSQARPGDVVIMQGGGISHTEMVADGGRMIGSNNTNPDGSQQVGYNALSYAAGHGGIVLRAPGGTGQSGGAATPSPTRAAAPIGAPAASESGRAQQAVSYFEGQGWSHAQASGIVANLESESSLNTGARGDGGSAYGLAQWHPDRQATFQQHFGHSMQGSSFQEQLEFVQYELTHTETGAASKLRGASTASEAGAVVSRYYERPLDADSEAAARATRATSVFSSTH